MNESHNPYLPPKAKVVSEDLARPIHIAGKGRRFGTFVIDYLGAIAFAFCLVFVFVLVFRDATLRFIETVPEIVQGVILFLIYYMFFEGIWARTPGKWVFGTVVVAEDGTKPPLRTILIRTLCRMIPFEVFSFLGSRGWHDGISNTHVVLTRPPETSR